MKTRRLTEQLTITILTGTTGTGGEFIPSYNLLYSLYGNILNDQATDNNQFASTPQNRGTVYSDRLKFYLRYLPITLNNAIKKQYKVVHNGNEYYITGLKHVANRKASIIEVSSNV